MPFKGPHQNLYKSPSYIIYSERRKCDLEAFLNKEPRNEVKTDIAKFEGKEKILEF